MTDITAEAPARVAAQPATAIAAGSRIQSIDILRGMVIVLMALDHVRDYFHISGYAIDPLDPAQTHPWLYATRWITHYCAPTFVFLSGVSAWLQIVKGKTTPRLSLFLLTRGLWLIVLEATVISFGWSFAFPYPFFLQVIWAIGCSMIALSALVWLPRAAVLAIGVALIAGHNLLDPLTPDTFGGLAWTFLHEGGPIIVGAQPIGLAAYPILPWIGVIAFGYGMGALIMEQPAQRDRKLVTLGATMVAAFFVLRGFNLYGDPTHWAPQSDWVATVMIFLDITKYPPSLMYVLITLGPVLALIPLIERMRGPAAKIFCTFGAVPFFFYVLHVYLVHALGIAANAAAGRDVSNMFGFLLNVFTAPERLAGAGFPLAVAYLAWIAVLLILYPLCRWWMGVKARRRDWWLSYL
jgi:uncharacterized membrane protein